MRILPLFIPHQGCPFNCVYCNQYSITQTKEATESFFRSCIEGFCKKNLTQDKEIAFFGGTFTALSFEKQKEYLDLVLPYLDQLRGIRISTRPDYVDQEKLTFLKNYKVSTIELGIQSFNSEVLKRSGRGYTSETAIKACQEVKDRSFDLIIQLMPGLPGDTFEYFKMTLQQAVNLEPQGIRLYPTVVLKDTTLETWYKKGLYQPLELEEAIKWLKFSLIYCKKNGVNVIKTGLHSDLSDSDIIAGPYHPAIGELINIDLLYDELIENWKFDKTLSIPGNMTSLFLGHDRKLIKKLKSKLLLDKIAVTFNKDQKGIECRFTNDEAQYYW